MRLLRRECSAEAAHFTIDFRAPEPPKLTDKVRVDDRDLAQHVVLEQGHRRQEERGKDASTGTPGRERDWVLGELPMRCEAKSRK